MTNKRLKTKLKSRYVNPCFVKNKKIKLSPHITYIKLEKKITSRFGCLNLFIYFRISQKKKNPKTVIKTKLRKDIKKIKIK